jgi:hypothetical protein
MPKCVVCQSLLPPDFLEKTEDNLAAKCLFCNNGNDTIEYFSESEKTTKKVTKSEIVQEYQEFLKEVSEMPSIKAITDAIKERGDSGVILK